MKMALSFISGIIVCSLILFGVKSVVPVRAETNNSNGLSDNLTQSLAQSLADFLPDIEKIYKESLTMPFRKAQSKIYDEDIAEFYQELLENSVLSDSEDGTE